MQNFVQEGDAVTIAAPAALASGRGVLVGSLFGVAANAAASGADVVLRTEGVFDLTAESAATATVGAKAYFVTATSLVNATASGNKLIGVFTVAKANGETTARVRLDGISI